MGQTCVAPDFVLCHESKIALFQKECKKAIGRLYKHEVGGEGETVNEELGRIITKGHAQRLLDIIKEVEDTNPQQIVYGGSKGCNVNDKFISPTIICDPSMDSRLMKEELFGPILPIVSFKTKEEAISLINGLKGIPLAIYVFTKSKHYYESIMKSCPAGSFTRNDALLQLVIKDFPFGGLGSSGIGTYTGKHSFDTFTHKLSSMYHPVHAMFEYGGLR
jgi:aldehyde dehydrogenase (NAD+)